MKLHLPERLWYLSLFFHRKGMKRVALVVKGLNYFLHRTLLPAEAVVGKNLRLEHYSLGVVMHPNVTIGDDVRIYHHVTIAGEMPIGAPERVVIGNGVTIGVNAVILPRANQGLKIGNNVIIGAGAIVTKDIPDRAIVAGTPASILRYRDDLSEKERGPSGKT